MQRLHLMKSELLEQRLLPDLDLLRAEAVQLDYFRQHDEKDELDDERFDLVDEVEVEHI